jgi:hypothetical protein
LYEGIERIQPRARRFDFLAADVARSVQRLAMKVADIDAVGVRDTDLSDAGGTEIYRYR